MIGDPPVLTLRQNFERPSAAQVAAFEGVPTGFVVDAQMGQGAVDQRIKPLWAPSAFAAPAVTVKCGPRDNMGVWIAMRIARPWHHPRAVAGAAHAIVAEKAHDKSAADKTTPVEAQPRPHRAPRWARSSASS